MKDLEYTIQYKIQFESVEVKHFKNLVEYFLHFYTGIESIDVLKLFF